MSFFEETEDDGTYANLAIVFRPHFRMLPTEGFEFKNTVVFFRYSFSVDLPSDLCVLVSENYMLRRPGVIEGIQVKCRIKRIVGRLNQVARLRGWKWCGCGYDGVVDAVFPCSVRDVLF